MRGLRTGKSEGGWRRQSPKGQKHNATPTPTLITLILTLTLDSYSGLGSHGLLQMKMGVRSEARTPVSGFMRPIPLIMSPRPPGNKIQAHMTCTYRRDRLTGSETNGTRRRTKKKSVGSGSYVLPDSVIRQSQSTVDRQFRQSVDRRVGSRVPLLLAPCPPSAALRRSSRLLVVEFAPLPSSAFVA